ncbi:hypothetical protein Aperf_G00000023147 [Anoplocephala perfoliata]
MSLIRPKVADALSYLDQVKARFSNQNEIYNDFLDVMRQFKAQSIGTDVVIRRVRELFHGHPDLIVGFNTFIPQGYRLEGPSVYSRTSSDSFAPVGQVLSSEINPGSKLPSFAAFRHSDAVSHEQTPTCSSTALPYSSIPQASDATFYLPTVTQPPVLRSQLTTSEAQPPLSHCYQRTATPNNQNILETHMVYSTPVPPSHQSQPAYVPNAQQQQQQQHNAQSFNHAIIYVNKVKNRFQAKPDVYKRFLEILQWYQREQEHTDTHRRKHAEMQVFQDVAKLLNGHDDLLQEFSRFLPESTSMASDTQDTAGTRISQYGSVSELSSAAHNRYSSSGASESSGWIRGQPDSMGHLEPKKLKRGSAASSSQAYGQSDSITMKKSRQTTRDMSLSDAGIASNGPEATLLQKSLTQIRNALDADNGSRFYQVLLQNINLYNRKLINEKNLMDSVTPILHRFPDLNRQFYDMFILPQAESGNLDIVRSPENEDEDAKGYVPNSSMSSPHMSDAGLPTSGNRNRQQSVAQMVAAVSELSQKRLDLDFTKLRVCGASYRMLPPNFIQPKCSGRAKSDVARTVLNNTYISFSSMNSEDSQFVTSKKNMYEDGLYHTEDERYEADMVMEVNRAALQNLVVIKNRLDRMNREEAQNFRLDDYLGGNSSILMKKALHRVYGDKAIDVIHGLKNCPYTVVPIVISRMRQKEAEWSESLRKFQPHWAEQDSKNYLRSLDYQGNHFRNRDTHLFRPKCAISAIESIARGDKAATTDALGGDNVAAMLEKGLSLVSAPLRPVSPSLLGATLNYVIEGTGENGSMHMTLEYPPPEACASLLQDVASLIIHHVKRQQNTNKEDKRTMKFFMRTVLQDLFMQERFPMSDDEADDENCESEEEEGEEVENEGSGDSETAMGNTSGASKGTQREKSEGASLSPEKGELKGPQKHLKRENMKELTPPGTIKAEAQAPEDDPPSPSVAPAEEYYCFTIGNNQLYSFLRLHHLLLTRLFLLQARAQVMQQEYRKETRSNEQVANILSLRKKDDKEPGEYYRMALNLVKEVLDGCEDVHTYEDRLRDMFGIYAYPWYTMDRLINNIVKQLHSLAVGDDLSCRLTDLFKSRFRTSGGRFRNDSEKRVDGDEARFTPAINDICGPLRTRYVRIRSEAKFQYSAFSLCLEQAACANEGGEEEGPIANRAPEERAIPSPERIPNCFTIVMIRQASKLLIRLNDPHYMINTYLATPPQSIKSTEYRELDPHIVLPPSPNTEVKATRALKRAEGGDTGEIRSWYDYLARYLLVPGCWTAGPISARLVAEVRPVFLYRNARKCVKELTKQAAERRASEAVESIDPQPEEVLLRSSEAGEDPPQSEQEDLEKDIWEVMKRVLRNSLTRSEIFRDCYSSDCMQSSKALKSAGSTPKNNSKINWHVGSYGIFIRSKKNRLPTSDRMSLAAEKFHAFQAEWLSRHGNQEQIEVITAQLKRKPDVNDHKPAVEAMDISDEEAINATVLQPSEVLQTEQSAPESEVSRPEEHSRESEEKTQPAP